MKLKNKLAVLCVTGFALLLISTAALADLPAVHNGPPSPEMMKEMLANPWSVEFITADGQYSVYLLYDKRDCSGFVAELQTGDYRIVTDEFQGPSSEPGNVTFLRPRSIHGADRGRLLLR